MGRCCCEGLEARALIAHHDGRVNTIKEAIGKETEWELPKAGKGQYANISYGVIVPLKKYVEGRPHHITCFC